MKFLSVGPGGRERPAVIDPLTGEWRDISTIVGALDPAFLAATTRLVEAALSSGNLPLIDQGERIGAPFIPGKIICIGLNYRDHAEETNARIPEEPIVFMKAPDTVVGPNDTVLIPRKSRKTDWEVELAVVIGAECRYLGSHEQALANIAGYAISNDVSEREFQIERGGQWDKGKNSETFNPFGPWLVTADEIADPQSLGLQLSVNGVLHQDGSTANMIFGVAETIVYLSQFMVLYPGDVINTGTPAGVALGQPEPKPYLRDGDIVELAIDGLGSQRQVFRAA